MSLNEKNVYISGIDEDRFGIKIAKSVRVTGNNLPYIMNFCQKNKIKLLIARCPTNDFPIIHAMEEQGFLLMDTLVYYSCNCNKTVVPSDTGEFVVRGKRLGEEKQVTAIAADSFHGYLGHYHADEKLNNSKCDEVYISWATNSCLSHNFADKVMVAELNGKIVGFVTIRVNHHNEGEISLGGVSRSIQKSGVFTSLILHGMKWCISHSTTRMVVSSQITNTASQKVFARLGFEIRDSCYTFHKWFD